MIKGVLIDYLKKTEWYEKSNKNNSLDYRWMVFGDAVDLNTELAMREKIERCVAAAFVAAIV